MSAAWKIFFAGFIAVVPGGLLLLALYALTRACMDGWQRAAFSANGQQVELRNVWAEVDFRETFRQSMRFPFR